MKQRRAKLLIITVIALAVACLVFAVALGQAYVSRRHAEEGVVALQQIIVGSTDYSATKEILRTAGINFEESAYEGSPEVSFSYDNRGLCTLRLAPYTDFRAQITFKNGTAVEKSAILLVPTLGYSAKVVERRRGIGFPNEVAPSDFPCHIVQAPSETIVPARTVTIQNDSTYPQADRQKDWAFNLSCLTLLGGCNDARMMLPSARNQSRK